MNVLYESDFFAWTQEQTKLLQSRKWELLDTVHLFEELESLGRWEQQKLRNCMGVLLGHLLKWQFQPENRSNSGLATLREQRREILLLLSENPSLNLYFEETLSLAYQAGLDLAVQETNLPYSHFPATCPYRLEQALDPAYLPF